MAKVIKHGDETMKIARIKKVGDGCYQAVVHNKALVQNIPNEKLAQEIAAVYAEGFNDGFKEGIEKVINRLSDELFEERWVEQKENDIRHSENEFSTGDIVRLKPSGHEMMVSHVFFGQVLCQWTEGDKPQDGFFAIESLEMVKRT
jgi:uncharacterized protein YodC (DUF2158 family)